MDIDPERNCDIVGCKNVQENQHIFTYEVTNQNVLQNLCDLHYDYIILYGWFYGEGVHPHTWRIKNGRIVPYTGL